MSLKREAPPWIVAGAIIVVVAGLAVTGWIALRGSDGRVGPDMKVKPGMYDLQKMARDRATRAGASTGADPADHGAGAGGGK